MVGEGRGERGSTAKLSGRYEILPDKPIPTMASPVVPAFVTRDARSPSRLLFALLCPKELPFREEALVAVRRLNRPQLLTPLEWGLIDWPGNEPAPGRRPAIIFETPGSRLMPSLSATIRPMSEEVVTQQVLRPVLTGLKELAAIGMSHGAVRPDNLFHRSHTAGDLMLGEGYSAPPGFTQPALLKTINSAMCSPGGAGLGSFAEDLYALGVTLLLLLLGRNPLQDQEDHAIIAAKIAQGSYAAIAGQARVSSAMAEVLRGLLADNPAHRWSFDQLDAWLDGRRLSPKPPSLPPRAGRPFTFDGVEYWTRPALAHAMASSWDQAIPVAQSRLLEPWLKRSLGDGYRADVLASAATMLHDMGASRHAGDALVAWALMALDPAAPIRYRDFAASADSLGLALAAGFDQPGMLQLFADVVEYKLPQAWIELQGEARADTAPMRKLLNMLRQFLDKPGPGYSIERCLYELNPDVPCRSSLLKEEYVSRLSDLLPALERVAARIDRSREPIDRHIAAFLAARTRQVTDRDLEALGPNVEPYRRRLAMLRLLAAVEPVTGMGQSPALRAWLGVLVQPILDSYHHRPYRKALRREVTQILDKGPVADLVALLDNESLRRRDSDGFSRARARYAAAQHEVAWLEENGMTSDGRVMALANRVSAITSGVVAGLFLFGLLVTLTL